MLRELYVDHPGRAEEEQQQDKGNPVLVEDIDSDDESLEAGIK